MEGDMEIKYPIGINYFLVRFMRIADVETSAPWEPYTLLELMLLNCRASIRRRRNWRKRISPRRKGTCAFSDRFTCLCRLEGTCRGIHFWRKSSLL